MLKAMTTSSASETHFAILRKREALHNNPALETACNRATALNLAIEETLKSVAEMHPSRPETDAAYAVAERLRPRWRNAVDEAARLEAATGHDIRLKAKLIQLLVERDEQDNVVGSEPLRLAAALATDLLAYEWIEA